MLLVSHNGGTPYGINLADALVTVNGETYVDDRQVTSVLSEVTFTTKDHHTLIFYGSQEDIRELLDDHNLPSPAVRSEFNRRLMNFISEGYLLSELWGGREQEQIERWLNRTHVASCLTMSFDEWLAEFAAITERG